MLRLVGLKSVRRSPTLRLAAIKNAGKEPETRRTEQKGAPRNPALRLAEPKTPLPPPSNPQRGSADKDSDVMKARPRPPRPTLAVHWWEGTTWRRRGSVRGAGGGDAGRGEDRKCGAEGGAVGRSGAPPAEQSFP